MGGRRKLAICDITEARDKSILRRKWPIMYDENWI